MESKRKHDGGGGGSRRNKDNLIDGYENRKEGRSRREERREERRRRERSNDHHHHHHGHHHHRNDRRLSESPPSSPRVTILKHSETSFSKSHSNLINQPQLSSVSSTPLASSPSTPVHFRQNQQQHLIQQQLQLQQQQQQQLQLQQQQQQQQLQQAQQQGISNVPQNTEDIINEMIENIPSVMKLIDTDSWSFFEHPAADYLFSEAQSSGAGGFTVISAVGMQSSGKSSLLNRIAGLDVFRTHADPGNEDSLLRHVTRGVDLHITRERLFLLDCQPLMSASILDDYIKNGPNSSNVNSDASEPETYVYITSLQLLSFLLAISDYVVVVNDWTMDTHLIKLLATAMMMVGNDSRQAELIFQFPEAGEDKRKKSLIESLRSLLGAEYTNIKEIIDESEPLPQLIKLLSRRPALEGDRGANHACEKSWLVSAQRYWENSIRKSTLFSDYARLMI